MVRHNATRRRLALLASVALFACDGEGLDSGRQAQALAPSCAQSPNDEIRLLLATTCAACHSAGATSPFFATLTAFEDLLAYNPRFVVRGDPDASPLVALLEGRGTGTYAQMPLSGDAFSARADRGETAISMEEVRTWIRDLPERTSEGNGIDMTAPVARRLEAGEWLKAVQVALGQEPTGGIPPLLAGPIRPLSPDSPITIDYNDGNRRQVYQMLGGASYLRQRMPEPGWSPSSLLALTQAAQGACRHAVDNDAPLLFQEATLADTSDEAPEAIQANIAALYDHFLQDEAAPEDLRSLYEDIFLPAEAAGTAAAWTQVCTALVRDPLFITF